jgi:DNA-directed RNA polymerase subunit F
MKVKEEKFVSWFEAKKILEKKSKEKELGYEQKNALEFLRKFSKLPAKKIDAMITELSKIERLKEKHIINIIDLLPKDLDDLRILFANEIITLSDDEKKKILSIVKKFT